MNIRLAALAALLAVAAEVTIIAARARASSADPVLEPVAAALRSYAEALDGLDVALDRLDAAVTQRDRHAAGAALGAARLAYKRVEWLAEHYTPVTALALNGPAADRPDEENPRVVVPPTGLQVIGMQLQGAGDAPHAFDAARLQVQMARVNARRLRERVAETPVTGAQLFDAARVEIARITTLGIAGFDTPEGRGATTEAAASIDGFASSLAPYASSSDEAATFRTTAARAVRYLTAHPEFARLDHYELITRYLDPLARALADLRRAAGVPSLTDPRAWSASAVTVFDRQAFDPGAFAPPGARHATPAMVALGQRLFNDPRLSGSGTRSCASCHQPQRAFTDGRRFPALLSADTVPGHRRTTRNTPTMLNAALQASQFADGRVAFLEDQVSAVISNRHEMGGDVERAASALAADVASRARFAAAFGASVPAPEMGRAMRAAIAAYVRSLVRLDAPFDRAMRGDDGAMTASERRGFNLFMGRARCGTCHFAPLFNGTAPPAYADAELEVLGVPARRGAAVPVDADRGAGAVDGAPLHEHAFKTPTVRNAAVTAPYMHNGVYRTLEEVVDFYNAGGAAGVRGALPNQTLPGDSLHLSARDRRDLVAFIGALTDTASRAFGDVARAVPSAATLPVAKP